MVKIYQAAKGARDKPQQLKQIEVQIERLDHEAQGIGFEQKRIVFVTYSFCQRRFTRRTGQSATD
jgi:23S rRNA (uracil1939-C5)-methyltransferase